MSQDSIKNWDADDEAISNALNAIRIPDDVRDRLLSKATAEAGRVSQPETDELDAAVEEAHLNIVERIDPPYTERADANRPTLVARKAVNHRFVFYAVAVCLMLVGSVAVLGLFSSPETFDTRLAALEVRDLVRQHIDQASISTAQKAPSVIDLEEQKWIRLPAQRLSIPIDDLRAFEHGLSQLESGKTDLIELRSAKFSRSAWLAKVTPNSEMSERFAAPTFEIVSDVSGGIGIAVMQADDSLIVLCVAGGEPEVRRWLKPVQLT